MSRFVLLSGPSCVGKGPLIASVKRLYPDIYKKLRKVILFNDRDQRPGEVDGEHYHFRSQREIKAFPQNDYVVEEIREGNFQALQLQDIREVCRGGSVGFLEAFHRIGAEVKRRRSVLADVNVKTVFLSPLSQEEIEYLKNEKRVDLRKFIIDVMRKKLLRRVQKQKGIPSAKDLKDVEKRAATSYDEMKSASQYDYVLPNYDGEDSDNWEQFYYPIGAARKALLSFIDILEGNEPEQYERWSNDLLP